MQFRRSGQRDSRRRRVLADLVLGSPSGSRRSAAASSRRSVEQVSENYGDAEFLDEQLRLTDLVPRRPAGIVLLFGLGLLVIAALEGLYAWMPRLAAETADGRIAALDLTGPGSLGVWFSSTMLLLAAAVAVIVYSVRRYRKDDYQGHYRVWLWAAMCWLVLSVEQTAAVRVAFQEMMTLVTGTRLMGDGSMWWAVAYFFLLGGVGVRLLVDMRHCRLAFAALLLGVGGYGMAAMVQFGWIAPEDALRGVMLQHGATLVGNLLFLLAMVLTARYVILDAQGLLPARAIEQLDEDEIEEEEEEEFYDEDDVAAEEAVLFGQSVRVHPPHNARAPARSRLKPDAFTAGMEAAENRVGRKLTKQEKKALRRRLEKQRRERRSA